MPITAASLLWIAAVAVPALLAFLAYRDSRTTAGAPDPRALVRALPDWPVRGALGTALLELDALTSAAATARAAGVPDSITRSLAAQAAVGMDAVRWCAARLSAVAAEVRQERADTRRGGNAPVYAVAASVRLAERLDRETLRLRQLAHAAQQARLALAEMTLSSRAVDDLPAAEAALREMGRIMRELTPLYGVRCRRHR
jgi:hypothetical protein